MFTKNRNLIITRIALVLALITGVFAVVPVHAGKVTADKYPGDSILKINNSQSPVPLISSVPAYDWHTFYGSNSTQSAKIAMDLNGNIYITAFSGTAWNGPNSTSPLNSYVAGQDMVIIKLDRDGAYQWHTFYGSSGNDYPNDIAVDSNGNVYIVGQSSATWDGPGNASPLNTFAGGGDMVLIKLDNAGTYQWHTFYGATTTVERDEAKSVSVDLNGNIFLTGWSVDTWNGPGSISPLNGFTGNADIVIVKLDAFGVYQWHTFYGSSDLDFPNSIGVDSNGNVYVVGTSKDWNGPGSTRPLRAFGGGSFPHIVIIKLNNSGTYQWHTFYGTSEADIPRDMDIDTGGNIYIAGSSATG
ncbi:MAG: SBBP repeat-containing protein [Anaerolineales bacterium]|nr:SBBP repeat-containing protein [Anaerolineales bacterium]